ncbi:hypothetical protein EMCRGX_G014887 [Ephydatia muelleri]
MLLSTGLVLTLYIGWGIAANTVVNYSSREAITSYGDSGLHVVLVFHTTDAREMLLKDLIEPLAAKSTQLVFVLVDRENFRDVARAYFLPRDPPDCYIIVVPPGKKDGIHVPPTNIPYTVSSLSHLFASMLNEPAPQKQGMSFVDARYVSQTVAAMPKNVIAAFCWDGGSSDCKNYSTLLEAAVNLDQRLHIEPMVVTVHDLKDLPNGVTVPSINMYNITSRQWTKCGDNVTQCITENHSHSKGALLSGIQHPWLAEQLNEDDYFGLVARKESPAVLPPSLFLTDKTFISHVTKYKTTAVVFCLKWSLRCKHLFHHVMRAAEELDRANNSIVSLKVVSCGDFPDVCALNGITSYPTILVFHGSTKHSYQYRGMMDVDHLLEAVELHPPAQHSLVSVIL